METIRQVVHSLVVIVVLATIVEMMLPGGEMRRYVRLVVGLFLIIALVQPAVATIKKGFNMGVPMVMTVNEPGGLTAIMEEGRRLNAAGRSRALEEYRSGLSRQVLALAGMNKSFNVVSADVQLQSNPSRPDYGGILGITLVVAPGTWEVTSGQDSMVAPVRQVEVQVEDEQQAKPSGRGGGSIGAAEGLVKIIANFFNLSPEQVQVKYR